jgi:hypothetical protein
MVPEAWTMPGPIRLGTIRGVEPLFAASAGGSAGSGDSGQADCLADRPSPRFSVAGQDHVRLELLKG